MHITHRAGNDKRQDRLGALTCPLRAHTTFLGQFDYDHCSSLRDARDEQSASDGGSLEDRASERESIDKGLTAVDFSARAIASVLSSRYISLLLLDSRRMVSMSKMEDCRGTRELAL